ncbi:MAG: hypothetical protein RL745_892 [Actinomycetota bacterium]|jgi:uncharacterized protein with FMN-binding domain
MKSPNAAKRVLLAVLGAVAGAATVTSTVSHGVPHPVLSGGTDVAGSTDVTGTSDPTPAPAESSSSPGSANIPAPTVQTGTPSPSVQSSTPPADTGVSGEFTGSAAQDGPWGSITVTISVKNNRIVDSSMQANVYDRQSQFINNQMSDWNTGLTVPEALKRQTLKAQSAQISGVSGATYTSYAYAESLASALAQAGL